MRIKITLSTEKPGIIDFNYQHQIQGLIYAFLSSSDPDYSAWLHEQGFVYDRDKNFKLFVFSGIIFHGPIKIHGSNRLNGFSWSASSVNPFTLSFQIASPVHQFIQHLIEGIFKEGQEIRLGKQSLQVYRIETLPDPLNGNLTISPFNKGGLRGILKPLESPIFVKKPMPEGERDIYLFPGDKDYEELLNQNLIHKYETLYGKPYKGEPLKFDFKLSLYGNPSPLAGEGWGEGDIKRKTYNSQQKTKLVKSFKVFKNGKITGEIKGTLQPFTVSGSEELIKIGLECGFGQNNSMGCGYVEVVKRHG